MEHELVVGLEVHAQLRTDTKIFCGCTTRFGADPNANTCPVCLGLPGVLPVLNRRVVEFAIRLGLAVGSRIAERSIFARKNYFYPDLPKGYQISQYETPVCVGGAVPIDINGAPAEIGLTRIHMEEDAGKNIHDEAIAGTGSLVDLNRAGVPLLEIVSEPELRGSEQAGEYLRSLRAIVMYLDVCDGNMEEGSLRCDANVSVRKKGESQLGTKVEIKNLNSFRNVERAIDFERERQIDCLERGEAIVHETRLWDADRNVTESMRGKEEAHDYRYFPEPDLVPLSIDPAWVARVRETLPELPRARTARFEREYELPHYDAIVLTSSRPLADYLEAVVATGASPKQASNWIKNELLGLIEGEIGASPVTPERLGELIALIGAGTISGKIAKGVLSEMVSSERPPAEIVKARGLMQLSDEQAIIAVVDEVIAASPGERQRYRDGATKLLGYFVGQVMKRTEGTANPALVNKLLKERL
ncbi:MAG: Asp-tRNA(Asn)/Glu-tRNA(Gln) amidotransferase subunit GatB [Myxococcota bacterium]